jgi:hypothetical protein
MPCVNDGGGAAHQSRALVRCMAPNAVNSLDGIDFAYSLADENDRWLKQAHILLYLCAKQPPCIDFNIVEMV